MGLSNALNIANSGLRTIGAGLNTVATNVAQAEVEGYKRQDLRPRELGGVGGVTPSVVRAADRFLEHQVRIETARSGAADVNDYYLARVDTLFGKPGEAGSLDGMLNGFNSALQQLSTSPDDFVARQQAVGEAKQLTAGLNTISTEVQALRQLAEDSISTSVNDINDALENLENINGRLGAMPQDNPGRNEMLNERDRQVGRLADYMEIRVAERDNGAIDIYTKSGNSLLTDTAAKLSFDHRGNLTPGTQYSPEEAQRGVGTVTLQGANGYQLDLINNGTLDTGRIGALIDMRDNVLVETQAQLDEVAAGLASTLSDNKVEGTAVAAAGADGFDLDLSSLQPGNTISLSYMEGGTAKKVSLVRVDNPAQLPLSNDHTADPGDRVIGIDFSNGFAAAATSINTALSPAVNAQATATGLRFLDDGAAGTSDITTASSNQTTSALQAGGSGLPLFVDGNGPPQQVYSGNMEGVDQKTGFAQRIGVNAGIIDNSELLVRASADTPVGDPARPLDLVQRLNSGKQAFSPQAGIGDSRAPYQGSVMDYTRLVISDQTDNAANAAQVRQSQKVVVDALNDSLNSRTGVNIDEELGKLISLQNSFAANARILSATDEMMQRLLAI